MILPYLSLYICNIPLISKNSIVQNKNKNTSWFWVKFPEKNATKNEVFGKNHCPEKSKKNILNILTYYFKHLPGFWSWSRMGFRVFGNPWWTTRSWPALRFYTSRSSRWRFWLRARLLTKKTVLQMALVTQMPTT